MRDLADPALVRRFMRELGSACDNQARIYFTGGASAVLLGWRASTIDLDIKVVAQDESVLKAVPRLKDELSVNVELAAPDQFIPALPGWEGRSVFIEDQGRLSFYHYDFYSQALAKLERGHSVDLQDVRMMLERALIDPARLRELFTKIEPELYQYPAIDPASFKTAIDDFLAGK